MTYEETTEYLFTATPMFQQVGGNAYKPGLYNTLALDEHLGHPHRQYKTIHVAGTNGKGSCSHTLAAILKASGLKVGLFTSPHLLDFRERMRVNGTMVDQDYVVHFVEQHRQFFEPLHPSFFELTTAMAFQYFAEQHVDVAVIEVGLGGRLDCTNIITPVTSVITNISFDHTDLLGHTLPQIAAEKAGIIKPGIPVVIGEATDETRPVFERVAKENHAPLYFAEEEKEIINHSFNKDERISYQTTNYGNIIGQLNGYCQQKNANTILCTINRLKEVGFAISDQHVATGFAHVCDTTGLMARWQTLRNSPTVVCDTGHNTGGFTWITQQLNAIQKPLRIVFGMVNDKDIEGVLSMLPQNATYYFCQASVKRAMPHEELQQRARGHALHGHSYPTVAQAYHAALADSDPNDFIYVGGSTFVVADLLSIAHDCKKN